MKTSTMNLSKDALHLKPAKVKKDMQNHERDPFFVTKLQAAKKRLANVSLPEKLTGKK